MGRYWVVLGTLFFMVHGTGLGGQPAFVVLQSGESEQSGESVRIPVSLAQQAGTLRSVIEQFGEPESEVTLPLPGVDAQTLAQLPELLARQQGGSAAVERFAGALSADPRLVIKLLLAANYLEMPVVLSGLVQVIARNIVAYKFVVREQDNNQYVTAFETPHEIVIPNELIVQIGYAAQLRFPLYITPFALSTAIIVNAVTCHPRENIVAAACHDNKIRVFNLKYGSVVQEIETGIWGTMIAYSLDGEYIAIAGRTQCHIYTRSGEFVREETCPNMHSHYTALIAATNRFIAGMDDGTIETYPVNPRQRKVTLLQGDEQNGVESLALNHAQDMLAIGYTHGQVRIKSMQTADITELYLHQRTVMALAFSPDGRFLVSGGENESVVVSNTMTRETHNLLYTGNFRAYSLAYRPDGQVLAIGMGGYSAVTFVDPNSKMVLQSTNLDGLCVSLSYSYDGSFVAVAQTVGGSVISFYTLHYVREHLYEVLPLILSRAQAATREVQ